MAERLGASGKNALAVLGYEAVFRGGKCPFANSGTWI
jgi:hypothetical protein